MTIPWELMAHCERFEHLLSGKNKLTLKGTQGVKINTLYLMVSGILCLFACACGRNPIPMLVEGLFAGPTSENVPGIYEGKNYGGKERIVLRKDGTFSHSFMRDGSVVVTNDGTWLLQKDSMEIVFSSATQQAWPSISPAETGNSRYLKIWEGSSCSLTYYRDFGRKDVGNAANLFYSLDSPEEYCLWKTSEFTETPQE